MEEGGQKAKLTIMRSSSKVMVVQIDRLVPNVNILSLFSPPGPLRGIQRGTLRTQGYSVTRETGRTFLG